MATGAGKPFDVAVMLCKYFMRFYFISRSMFWALLSFDIPIEYSYAQHGDWDRKWMGGGRTFDLRRISDCMGSRQVCLHVRQDLRGLDS